MNFDAHCKACHPVGAPAGTAGGLVAEGFPLPHRVQPAELEPLLRGGYAAALTKANPAVAKTPLPGGRLDPAPAPKELAEFGAAVDSLTKSALTQASARGATCGKCHTPDADGKTVAALPQHTVWFGHATFNHVSHRGLTCESCHPGTGRPASAPTIVNEVEPISILGADSCRACHAPAGTRVAQADGTTTTAGGIRHGCTDCHRYHNGDRPLHGLGSPRRDPKDPQPLADFLRGGK